MFPVVSAAMLGKEWVYLYSAYQMAGWYDGRSDGSSLPDGRMVRWLHDEARQPPERVRSVHGTAVGGSSRLKKDAPTGTGVNAFHLP